MDCIELKLPSTRTISSIFSSDKYIVIGDNKGRVHATRLDYLNNEITENCSINAENDFKVCNNNIRSITCSENAYFAASSIGEIVKVDKNGSVYKRRRIKYPINILNCTNNKLISGGDEGQIYVWDVNNFNQNKHIIKCHECQDTITSLNMIDDNILLSSSLGGNLYKHDLRTGKLLSQSNELVDDDIVNVFSCDDYTESVVCCGLKNLYLYDLSNIKSLSTKYGLESRRKKKMDIEINTAVFDYDVAFIGTENCFVYCVEFSPTYKVRSVYEFIDMGSISIINTSIESEYIFLGNYIRNTIKIIKKSNFINSQSKKLKFNKIIRVDNFYNGFD
ncbi:hypothetical protein A3Q56_02429 [Intoshia linei]|uniref:Uncharacterized protein n=1 Tax=Intoshia linei TaxID=1819745 RepID=A0A177B863_9BILA|nr:hypothetical protein A3Q56_02429 [Intoshia linei]